MTSMHLVELLKCRGENTPELPAFIHLYNGTDEGSRLSYSELCSRADNIANHLLCQLTPGETALLAYPSGLDFICTFFACLKAGVIAVPVPVPRSRRSLSRIEAIANDCNCAVILTDSKTCERIKSRFINDNRLPGFRLLMTDNLIEPSELHRLHPAPTEEQTAFIQYTSGSTSDPRGVIVSHRNLKHNLLMLQAAALTDASSILVSWLPPFHDMGLVGKIIHTVFVGACCVVMPPEAFIQKPVRWLQAISKYRGTFSLAPNFAYEMCVSRITSDEMTDLNLMSWKMAGNGAEPIRANDIQCFYDIYKDHGFRPQTMTPCYGLAEATLFVSSAHCSKPVRILNLNKAKLRDNSVEINERASNHTQALVSCGPGSLEQTLAIVVPETRQLLGENLIGEIWVAGRHIPKGYCNQQQASRDVFHAYDNDGNGPFMRTGDLGFLNQGELFITGRLKDLIIIYGKNYYPQDIEQVVAAADPMLKPDTTIVFSLDTDDGEKVVIVQEVEKCSQTTRAFKKIINVIGRDVTDEFDISAFDICLVRKGILPKTSSGKIQRKLCKTLYKENSLTTLACLRDNKQREQVKLTRLLAFDDGIELTTLAANGLFGMQIPLAYGGLELSHVEMVQVLRKLAELDITTAMYLGVHHAGSYTITHHGTELLRQQLLPKLASGELTAAFALTESEAGSNPNALVTQATPTDTGWQLTGNKHFIGLGQVADVFTVFAHQLGEGGEPLGISAFLMFREAFNGEMEKVSAFGMKRLGQAHLDFRKTPIACDQLLGDPGQGMDIAYSTLHYNRLGVAAICVGAMQTCLQDMQAYASQRRITTGPLIDNPVTRQRLGSLVQAIYTVECLTTNLARWLDEGRRVPPELFIVAKNLGASYLWEAADNYVQLLGCRGYENSHPATQLLKDARAFRIIEGPSEALNHYLGTRLINDSSALKEFFGDSISSGNEIDQLREFASTTNIAPEVLVHDIGQIANYSLALMVLKQVTVIADHSRHTQVCDWLANEIRQQQHVLVTSQLIRHSPIHGIAAEPFSALNEKKKEGSISTQCGNTAEAEKNSKAFILLQIQQWISKALHSQFTVDDIDPEKPLSFYGLDSIMIMELSFHLGNLLGREINAELIWDYPTVNSLATYLAADTSKKLTSKTQAKSFTDLKLSAAGQKMKHPAEFSLFYFSSNQAAYDSDKYRLLIDGTKFADRHGFKAVWLPERHFHDFGGIYPSPSVLASALTMVTGNIRIRSGSVVLPLHNPIKVAEEWAVTDNLSNGRIDMGFATGWNVNDFVLSPDNYENRVQIMYEGIETIRRLWRGESIHAVNGRREPTKVNLFPLPVQKELPVWITCSGGVERFIEAGTKGYNVITALLFQTDDELEKKIASYRQARAEQGYDPTTGKVTLMLHTYVGDDIDSVKSIVRDPFIRYLESSVDLWRHESRKLDELEPQEKKMVLEYAFERYFNSASLFGTPNSLLSRVDTLASYGVDEFACLIDFGIGINEVMEGLTRLKALMESHKYDRVSSQSNSLRSLGVNPPDANESFTSRLHELSDNQRALWFLYKLNMGSHAYDVLSAYRLNTLPDVTMLQTVFNQIVERHSVLSSGLVVDGQKVYLHTKKYREISLIVHDVSEESWAQINEHLQPDNFLPFNLEAAPLFQIHLYKCPNSQAVLLLRAHHMVTDFWSVGIITRELQMLYQAARIGKTLNLPPARSYIEFTHEQAHHLSSPRSDVLWSYWIGKLETATMHLDLPHDTPALTEPGFNGDSINFTLHADIADELRNLGKNANTTLFTVLLTLYSVFLHRYTHQDDILIGTPALGRNDNRYWKSVGYFVNTIVIRADLTNDPDFFQLFSQLDKEVKAASVHQELPFSQLVERLQPQQRRGRSPVIQVLFDMLTPKRFEQTIKRTLPAVDGIDGCDMSLHPLLINQQQGQFELALEVVEQDDDLLFTLKYNCDLFYRKTAQRMADNLRTLIDSVIANNHIPISQLPLITKRELKLIQSRYWKRAEKTPLDPLTTWFQNQVDKAPDNIALIDGQQTLSYRQLDRRSTQVAHSILTADYSPGDIVAVQMDRSADAIIAILGVLKSGCAYLPLDAGLPKERILGILQDAAVTTLLTQYNLCDYTATLGCHRIYLDRLADWNDLQPFTLPNVRPQDMAYIMYTSGSTGKPKGVRITHANVSHLLTHMLAGFKFTSADIWTLFHSTSFDFSVWEIWGALATGASLVIIPHEVTRDPQAFYEMVANHHVTILNQTPSAFRQFIQVDAHHHLRKHASLHTVFLSGERLDVKMLEPWFHHHNSDKPYLYNMYGITEATVFTTLRRITVNDLGSSASPIGMSFDDSSVYLLDHQQQPVPIGVTGEIYIDGEGITVGYLGRDDLNCECLLDNRLTIDKGRLYKTGDLARINSNGELEFLGRCNRQVKIRGFRIELAEIETVLMKQAGITQAVVNDHNHHNGTQLVAYIVTENFYATINVSEIKTSLRQQLPDYMVPTHILLVSSIPVNANGKTDLTKLPAPATVISTETSTVQDLEDVQMAAIWENVLGTPVSETDSNFFDVGGDSLALLRLALEIENYTGQQIAIADLLQHPMLSDQAKLIAEKKPEHRRNKKNRKRLRNLLLDQVQPMVASLLWLVYRLIMSTVTVIEIDKPSDLSDGNPTDSPLLLAHWHGDGIMLLHRWIRQDIVLMASKSRAGRLMATILQRQGFRMIFGSQSSGGSVGLQTLINEVRGGACAALAVDGSRGPLHKVKPGIVELSRQTQTPIQCVACACSRGWIIEKIWDKTVIPKPFSRVIIKYGDRIMPPDANISVHEDAYQTVRLSIENSLNTTKSAAGKLTQ